MISRAWPRCLAAALALVLACPAPSFALRTQAGLESTEAEALTATFTGLEERDQLYSDSEALLETEFDTLKPRDRIGIRVAGGEAVAYYEVVAPPVGRAMRLIRVNARGSRLSGATEEEWPFAALVPRSPRLVHRTGLEEGGQSPAAGGASLDEMWGGSSRITLRSSPLEPGIQWIMADGQVVKIEYGAFWSLELDLTEAAAYGPASEALEAITEIASPAPFDVRDNPFENVRVRYLLQGEALASAPAFRAAGVRDFVAVITKEEQIVPLRALGMPPQRMIGESTLERLPRADDCRTLTTMAEAEAVLQALVAEWPSSQTLGPLIHPAIETTSKFLAALGV